MNLLQDRVLSIIRRTHKATRCGCSEEHLCRVLGIDLQNLRKCVAMLVETADLWSAREPLIPVPARKRPAVLLRRAMRIARHAVHEGHLVKPDACQGCVKPRTVHPHHDDPCEPLNVRWLCTDCLGPAQEERSLRARLQRGQPGRPKSADKQVLHVKLDARTYDAYCRKAITECESVHAIVKRVLVSNVPSTNGK